MKIMICNRVYMRSQQRPKWHGTSTWKHVV